jgi:hypothetical protein
MMWPNHGSSDHHVSPALLGHLGVDARADRGSVRRARQVFGACGGDRPAGRQRRFEPHTGAPLRRCRRRTAPMTAGQGARPAGCDPAGHFLDAALLCRVLRGLRPRAPRILVDDAEQGPHARPRDGRSDGTTPTRADLPGFMTLPWLQILMIFGAVRVSCLVVNDAVKILMVKTAGASGCRLAGGTDVPGCRRVEARPRVVLTTAPVARGRLDAVSNMKAAFPANDG